MAEASRAGSSGGDSDADLLLVVRTNFKDLFDRAEYQIHGSELPTDSLVYSEAEFEKESQDPTSFVAQILAKAAEL